jgi:hypothetical protein
MAFLDNSGDIILDAVLTDTGRMRLAKGDGSFRITKFALGDDEINYSLYDKNNQSGSAYFDLNILQTPVFEAFTNNIASLNSRLISISRNNLLYLPVLKINNVESGQSNFAISQIVQNGYILAVDSSTETLLQKNSLTYNSTAVSQKGVLTGFSPRNGVTIRVDQGIDNTSVPASLMIDPDLKETQYLLEIDNRFGQIVDPTGNTVATPSFIDDDDIATYYFSQGVDDAFIQDNKSTETITNATQNASREVIAGSRGTILKFKIKSSLEVATSDYLFNQVGSNITSLIGGVSPTVTNVRSIITSVRVTGLTTGYAIDVPLVLIKYIS